MSARAVVTALALAGVIAVPSPALAEPATTPEQVAEAESQGGMVRRRPKPTAPAPAPVETTPPAPAAASDSSAPSANANSHDAAPKMSPQARPAAFDRKQFRPDPTYREGYQAKAQIEVYGGKTRLQPPRPLLEFGYPMYGIGPIGEGSSWLGEKNPVKQQVLLYGDWRTTVAYNDDDIPGGDGETANALVATRLNLDLDWKLTGTERLHFLFRPLDRRGNVTRSEFQGAPTPDGKDDESALNGNVVVGFLEGDVGAIAQGIAGSYNTLDLPFAAGLIPLQFQNGIWVDDAFSGLAVTIPAMNSVALDISNMDITFFAGADRVSLPGVLGTDDHDGRVLGVATFVETLSGYVEAGYGYLMDERGASFDESFHGATVAFTRRYGNWLSNSVRLVGAFLQEEPPAGATTSAKGVLLLVENSLITRRPYTLIPYLNLFVGVDAPQSLARDPGTGGILKNTGLNFESDGLTGFPTLDASGRQAVGGALGLEYLFNLNQQFVVELAGLQRTAESPGDTSDYGLGLRYQLPFWKRFILRADGIFGAVNQGDAGTERDISGVRVELRAKF